MDYLADSTTQLFNDLGMGNLSEDQQRELKAKIAELALKRIFLETLEKLDEPGREAYEQLVNQKADPQEVERFLNARIPSYPKFVERILEEIKKELKADFQEMTKL